MAKSRLIISAAVGLILGCSLVVCLLISQREKPFALNKKPILQMRTCAYEPISSYTIQCYWFNNSAGFTLPVAVFKANKRSPSAQAIVFLPGGPGEGGNAEYDSLRRWDFWLSEGLVAHDLILFDYRGLAPGVPAIECDDYETRSLELLKQPLSLRQEGQLLESSLNSCLEKYQRSNHEDKQTNELGLSAINSLANADDAYSIAKALGYSDVVPFGVSYGTRVAMQMATYEGVSSLILDSFYSQQQDSLWSTALDWQHAFSQLWNECKVDSQCHYEIKNTFFEFVESLKNKPLQVQSINWYSSSSDVWWLTHERFMFAAFQSLYVDHKRSALIDLLRMLSNKEIVLEHDFYEYFYNALLNRNFNAFIFMVTQCNDLGSEPLNGEVPSDSNANDWYQFLSNAYGGDVFCRSPAFTQAPLKIEQSDKPVLLVSGRKDPVTPLRYSQSMVNLLPQGYLIELPNKGHGEFVHSACAGRVISTFLAGEFSKENKVATLNHESCELTWQ